MKKIFVTETFLPKKEELFQLFERFWKDKWITNRGEYVRELEKKIQSYLNLESNLFLTTNGTLALQLTFKTLPKNKRKIITTPYTYVATISAMVWENFQPIFVDIEPEYLTLDPQKVREILSKQHAEIAAIVPVHVYGNPADVNAFDDISKEYDIPVIYDAAHAFGVKYNGKSLFDYGDISIASFHATKIFHTIEGGAVFSKDKALLKRMFQMHNFGHVSDVEFDEVGINAKMNEFQAAMGLSVLPYMDEIIQKRKLISEWYDEFLNFNGYKRLRIRPGTDWNYSYYPIFFEDVETLKHVIKKLNENGIFPRRYFFPSLNKLPYLNNSKNMKVSEYISKRVICLPLFHGLNREEVLNVAMNINQIK